MIPSDAPKTREAKRIAGHCKCGRAVIKELNSPNPLWSDGTRYAYPERIDLDRWNIFRCESCHEPIADTFIAEAA